MGKKYILFGVVLVMLDLFGLCGCKDSSDMDFVQLPDRYTVFELQDWQSPDVEEDNSGTFIYNDRKYLSYSLIGRGFKEKDIRACLGCTAFDGEVREEDRVLALTYNDSDDYLLIFSAGPDLMRPPTVVYRAEDTRGKQIDKPDFIDDPTPGAPMYEYWKTE